MYVYITSNHIQPKAWVWYTGHKYKTRHISLHHLVSLNEKQAHDKSNQHFIPPPRIYPKLLFGFTSSQIGIQPLIKIALQFKCHGRNRLGLYRKLRKRALSEE